MTENQRKQLGILKEIFQFDQADLDFGIYRVMRLKRDELSRFIEKDLPAQITEGLRELQKAINSDEIAGVKKQIEATQASPLSETTKAAAIAELEEKVRALKTSTDIQAVESDVYNHLNQFFSLYYDEGDFISQRRNNDGAYVISSGGEEVKLHWANADQYYVKTSEYFKDYTFTTAYGEAVHFKVIDAETEKDNNKAGKKRFFQLHREKPFEIMDNALVIYMEYRDGEKKKQEEYTAEIVDAFIAVSGRYPEFSSLLTTADGHGETRLKRHLDRFTARNTFDYFIHKDLGEFLCRELDFYIKNDVVFLDDIEEQDEAKTREYITKAKIIRRIAKKIIALLAQIEDFQKTLYLKKKFVVETNYCITLDRVPQDLYAEIAENDAQREEWVRLFAIEEIKGGPETPVCCAPLTVEFLRANPFLVLDTAFFSEDFKERLADGMADLDESLDGLLIHSENFQALTLLQERYRDKIKCVYIDPPYNSPSSEILYKNSYKHSSWITLMANRLEISRTLAAADGSTVIAIDKHEHNWLFDLCKFLYPSCDIVSVAVEHNKKGTQGDHFSFTNEYAVFVMPEELKKLNERIRPEEEWEYSNFRNWGSESQRSDAANCFYPVYVQGGNILGYGAVLDDEIHPPRPNAVVSGPIRVYTPESGEATVVDPAGRPEIIAVYPMDDEGVERKWRYAFQSMKEIYKYLRVEVSRGGNIQIKMPKYSDQFKTMWYSPLYNAGDYGTKLITAMGFSKEDFAYPKSIHTVKDCIFAVSGKKDCVLDYFAGSGTTGHAVLNLNREDGGTRKYILVEMGEHFDTTTKPRMEKAIYSEAWSKGKPVSRKGSSHAFKYLRLESYEDALNNIVLRDMEVALLGEAREDYTISYMLNTESQDSGSMLNLDGLDKPFGYTMQITRGMKSEQRAVDLVETFNYLIGLRVERSRAIQSFDAAFTTGEYGAVSATLTKGSRYKIKMLEGRLPGGKRALVLWRELWGDAVRDNAVLDAFFQMHRNSAGTAQYGRIYVNGNNNLLNMRSGAESWKVVLIEEEMKKRMFGWSH